mgnify:CR=1 FL=1
MQAGVAMTKSKLIKLLVVVELVLIHDDGSVTSLPDKFCDCCETDRPALGGFTLKDMSGEAVIWLCSKCRG